MRRGEGGGGKEEEEGGGERGVGVWIRGERLRAKARGVRDDAGSSRDEGRCESCDRVFQGLRGVRIHQGRGCEWQRKWEAGEGVRGGRMSAGRSGMSEGMAREYGKIKGRPSEDVEEEFRDREERKVEKRFGGGRKRRKRSGEGRASIEGETERRAEERRKNGEASAEAVAAEERKRERKAGGPGKGGEKGKRPTNGVGGERKSSTEGEEGGALRERIGEGERRGGVEEETGAGGKRKADHLRRGQRERRGSLGAASEEGVQVEGEAVAVAGGARTGHGSEGGRKRGVGRRETEGKTEGPEEARSEGEGERRLESRGADERRPRQVPVKRTGRRGEREERGGAGVMGGRGGGGPGSARTSERTEQGSGQLHCITNVNKTEESSQKRLLTDALHAVDRDARQAAIRWPNAASGEWRSLEEDLHHIFERRGGGDVERRLQWFVNVCYEMCAERFGTVKEGKQNDKRGAESRRQKRLRELRTEKRKAKARWREAEADERASLRLKWAELKRRHRELRQAEKNAEARRKAQRERRMFSNNPFKFVKGLLDEGKSGVLEVEREELEEHLQQVYSDSSRADRQPEMSGLSRPSEPGVPFDCGELRWHEVKDFVSRAKGASAAGQNGLSFKFFKQCPSALKELWRILKVFWRREMVPQSWCRAEGVYIPKEKNAKTLGQFRPISLLNVDGKIFFGVLARRLTEFVMANGLIDASIQKAGIPGFPGCLEHAQTIWETIQVAKKEKKELDVVWLDLANAYGSIPHRALWFAMDFFRFPVKIMSLLRAYYDQFAMRFSTRKYTTRWQKLEVGIPMGCTVSPVLFVLAMEVLLRGARAQIPEVTVLPGVPQPAFRAFMDDITILSQKHDDTRKGVARLEELVEWMGMKFKARKCRSLSLRKGRVVDRWVSVSGERVPTLKEEPVKSLGRWYKVPLNDRGRGREVQRQVEAMLQRIDGTGLRGAQKVWCYEFGLLPRVVWPLTVYGINFYIT